MLDLLAQGSIARIIAISGFGALIDQFMRRDAHEKVKNYVFSLDKKVNFPEFESSLITGLITIFTKREKISIEPPRDCRRLQLMSRRSHYEQANEQIFT